MIDQAGIMMLREGALPANAYRESMTICQSPIIMIILNYIIWRKGNGTTLSRTVSTASIRENSFIFSPYVMHHSYGQENVPFKRLLVYFSREEVDSVQLLKV